MNVIEVSHLTKDYGHQKGIFDVSFAISQGETVGFLGPNGSGKTTTLRHLVGFIRSQQGYAHIQGMDCFLDSQKIQENLSYLPGEIAFMDDMTGLEFIDFIADMKNIKNKDKIQDLIDFLEFDPKGKIKRMSKGMKQKIGLVITFMSDADVLILDEPTSGLDPLMQNKFVELIKQSKQAGKTILMSSHIFEEVENTCDRVIMIKDGHIIAQKDMNELKNNRRKHFEITFEDKNTAALFQKQYPQSIQNNEQVILTIQGSIESLLNALSQYHIIDLNVRSQSLEELFLHYYGGDETCQSL